mmetsp:Transcript_90294/g.292214  ORF Transcript_90294/g.292214 Transcript_90294/m.292214 type:complete len:333 (-) Transcript_90294:24-1022(-)
MGKKPATKPKAKAKAAEPVVEETETPEQLEAKRIWKERREATKWAQGQLAAVRAQLEAAKAKGGNDWLQVAHEFHEVRLIKLVKRLEDKNLDNVVQGLRDGVDAYLAQCAQGPVAEQEGFKEFREAWDLLEPEAGAAYVRPAEAPEATAAAEQLRAWADASAAGVPAMVKLMQTHAASPGAQEAGLTRLGGLFSEAREAGKEEPGLTAAALVPAIEAAMRGHSVDPDVQRAGCAALRGVAMAEGQLAPLCDAGGVQLVVEAVKTHFKLKDVVLAGNGAFWAMAKAAGKNSPELSRMREADVPGVLKKCMDHHAWDQTLCGKLRVTLPFICED